MVIRVTVLLHVGLESRMRGERLVRHFLELVVLVVCDVLQSQLIPLSSD